MKATVNRQPPQPGAHPVEWLCEYAGTALLMCGGLSAICLDFGSGSRVAAALPSVSARLLLTGALFAATGSLIALAPLGRRSGAHLNPAVTLAFRITGHVHPHDLAGYVIAQCAGAITGTLLMRLAWGGIAQSVHDGVTALGPGVGGVAGTGIEALMTGVLILTVLGCVASKRLARWTPLAVWGVVTVLVWQGAPWTGTSLNPARSLGPALLDGAWSGYPIDVAGPLLGAVAAATLVRALPFWRPLTAKLFHDSRYPSSLGSALPVRSSVAA